MNYSGLDAVGKTPLAMVGEGIFAKLEFFNPSGSIKDRVIKFIVEENERKGLVGKGFTLVEATSGNTGISTAMVASMKGLKATIFMPENKSIERRKIMRLFGAKLVLTKDMEEAKQRAKKLGKKQGFFYLNQFENQLNPLAHEFTTGKEIVEELSQVDVLVAGMGTGGTILGIGRALKKKNPKTKIVGILPEKEPSEIDGIGRYYSENLFDERFLDKMVFVSSKQAFESAKFLARSKGLFVGPSSGANFFAAKKFRNKKVVTVFPDSGFKYLSKKLFQ